MATEPKMDSSLFNDFLKKNKDKIDAITKKNPTIAKDDEWRDETEWDDLFEEVKHKV